jgi:hypothetical protein
MALLSTTLSNLINGISQQAPTLRLTSELDLQENAYSSVIDGLSKRPPAQHIKRLAAADFSEAHIHTINRDSAERYTVVLLDGNLRVFDMAGAEKTVHIEAPLTYLETDTPRSSLRAVTVEDFTFILNTDVATAMDEVSLSPDPGKQGIVFVKQGVYATDYNVFINSFPVATKTTSASDVNDIKTDAIAADLVTTLITNLNTLAVSSATWTEGGIAAEGSLTINGWVSGAPLKFKRLTGTQEYAVGDSVGFSGVGGSSGATVNASTYVITNAQLSFSGTYPHLTPFWNYTLDGTVPGSVSGGSVHRTARQGEIRAGTLTQAGAFTGYVPAQGDRIYLATGTGITVGTYQVAAESRWGSGCHGNDFIQLLASPSTANVNLTAADIASYNNWLVTRDGSTILIKRGDGADFTLRTSDSYGDRVLFGFKDRIQRFSDLPTICVRDYLVEVTGDNAEAQDDYWVKFVPNNDAVDDFDKGVWVETVAPSIPYTFDPTTMPHILVRNGDGTFTYKAAPWTGREAGDVETAPNPSFVGHTISDIFFHRNRLGFLSDANTIMSRDSGVFDLFPATVTTLLDTDPIDLFAPSEKVALLKYAVPFREQLLLFSDQAQFVLDAPGLLTAQTASIKQATAVDVELQARPIGSGTNVYFAFPRGSFCGIWEYFVDDQTLTKDVADITSHVPKYIPKNPFKIAACSTEDVLGVLTDEDPSAVYLYKFFWRGNEKIQSSWSRFAVEAGATILNVDFIGSMAYLVTQRADGAYLESMNFAPGEVDEDSAFVTCLDRRLTEEDVTISYNAGTNVTTWTLPYTITAPMRVVIRGGDTDRVEGQRLSLLTQTGTTITATGDFTDSRVFIGQEYLMRWRFSQQFFHAQGSNGPVIVANGRWQLRTCSLVFNSTGYFKTSVTPVGRDTSVKEFSNVTLGVDPTGVARLATDRFRFAVLSDAKNAVIEVSSDSHLPCHITSAEFEGEFASRSGRA